MLLSNTIGAVLGLVASVLVKPGSRLDTAQTDGGVDTRSLTTVDIVADFIRNIFPPNLVGAALQVSQTRYTSNEQVSVVNISGQLVNQTDTEMVKSLGTVGSTNILGLIVVSAALGIATSQAGEQGRPFLAFFKAGAHIIFKLFTWIKWTTPVGSASLIAASLAKLDNLGPAFRSMGVFSLLVVVVNLVLIQLIGLSIVFFLSQRQNPIKFFAQNARAWLMAFGAINSTIPYAEYVRTADHYQVDPRVTEYVLPLSVTLNRCGSAAFITGTSVFVTQYTGVGTDVGSTFTIG
ncbi:amino acid transporter [Elysia marginata]|uniref:Amino acid transporter n=1 Tax=Elysia marginata TaxID=1093978 RepID=A0AAV4GIK5_9GAST|nr:amino acid transporter [Elysia marginata]